MSQTVILYDVGLPRLNIIYLNWNNPADRNRRDRTSNGKINETARVTGRIMIGQTHKLPTLFAANVAFIVLSQCGDSLFIWPLASNP